MDVGSSLEAQRAFVTEAVRLMLLRHANVVAFYGCSLHKDRGLLLMVSGGWPGWAGGWERLLPAQNAPCISVVQHLTHLNLAGSASRGCAASSAA